MFRAASAYWEDMPTSLRYDKVIAAGTSRWAALLFLGSNIPYLLLALQFGCSTTVRWPQDGGALCGRRELYVGVTTAMFVGSSLMHMAQLRCCGAMHGWQEPLKTADVVCVLTMIATPVVCTLSLTPLWYMVPCLPLFVVSQHYKKEGRVQAYLVLHSAWHVATAGAACAYATRHWM